ncbi:MAG: substrate-binding domain-containing protein, partial [Planctomycetota bacterium]|nr:substrate-binding domain-containing protein [Planctomycetota bacterium]
INLLRGVRVGGLIIAPAGSMNDIDVYQALQKDGVPFVFIDRIKPKIFCSSVYTDERKGALEIGRFLLKKGYRKWGYLKGPEGVFSSEEHEQGLVQSLKEGKEKSCSITSIQAGFKEEDGFKAAEKLLCKSKVDVIISVNDLVAVGVYRYLKKSGIKVPDEIGIVGFSNLQFMDLLEVPLTTVREPISEIGEKAVHLLMQEINNPLCEKQRVVLEPQLIVRKSV